MTWAVTQRCQCVYILYCTGSALLMILYTAIFPRSCARLSPSRCGGKHKSPVRLSSVNHSLAAVFIYRRNKLPASQPVRPDPQSNGQVGCGNNRKYSLWAYIASSGQMDWRTVTRIQSAYRITKQQSFVPS